MAYFVTSPAVVQTSMVQKPVTPTPPWVSACTLGGGKRMIRSIVGCTSWDAAPYTVNVRRERKRVSQ